MLLGKRIKHQLKPINLADVIKQTELEIPNLHKALNVIANAKTTNNRQTTMTTIFQLKENEIEKLSMKDYFKNIELGIDSSISVDKLTEFFTSQKYVETKPYLIRRKLIPKDTRFKQIEIFYKVLKKVDAIVWDINIPLSQLTDIFGEPIIHNEPYSDSTAFAFMSKNQNIEIIKTRHPKWLTIVKEKKVFEYQDDENQRVQLVDPEFSFIQFSLTNQ